MKRHGNLFQKIFTKENLYLGYLDARRNKRGKRACFNFERSLGNNMAALYEEIHCGNYQPQPYFEFQVYEPKQRTIYAPAFRDCVVQHAIYRVVYPLFNRTFIDTSFACRVGMGTHKAADYAQWALRQCDGEQYTLMLDIRKFFYSIKRPILKQLLERVIKDQPLVALMMQFAEHDQPSGIPIGNLLSQIYALIYMNPLDHFVKRELKVKYYARYVDDFVLFGLTRDQCIEYRATIIEFIREQLGLELSKSSIQKVKRGVNFVGYRTWRGCRFIRKHSLYKYRRAVKRGKLDSVVSILGHAKQTQSLQHMLDIAESNHAIYSALPKKIRRVHNLPTQRAA